MEAVEKEILSEAEKLNFPGGVPVLEKKDQHGFDFAAQVWAVTALRTFDGILLDKALAVSVALADFTAQLLREGTE